MSKQGCLIKRLSFLFTQIFFVGLFSPIVVCGQSLLTSFAPGDSIRLQIWQPWRITEGKAAIQDLNADYPVNSQGYTTLPLIGEVKVVGLNQKTLVVNLKDKYSPFIKDPYIMVTPLIRVTLQGSVNRPGAYLIPPTASLWEVVEMASGPTQNADLKKMRSERGGRVVSKSLLRSFEKGYSLQEIGILSGDQIIIPGKNKFTYRDVLVLATFGLQVGLFYLRVSE